MATVLMVAEKPSVAQAIASALSRGQMVTSGFGPCVTHEFRGPFPYPAHGNAVVRYKVTSVIGHLYGMDFTAGYQNWSTVDPAELFRAPVVKSEESKAGVARHLQREAVGCSAIVLWLDCDREGENICFEVMQNTVPYMTKGARVHRAKFSSVTEHDIREAMGHLTAPNENEARAVDARQELDLRAGVAFTRFQTMFFGDRYDIGTSPVSFGPCQTPTLGFCVARHDEIQSFVPEPHWSIWPTVDCGGFPLRLKWKRGHLFDHEAAVMFHRSVAEQKVAVRETLAETESKKARPTPLNTVELLKVASKQLRIGPQHAMQIAEHLYTSGYISYPRTESSRYPDSFDLVSVLEQHTSHPIWGNYVKGLLETGINAPKQGIDAGDHPPITPMTPATEGQLSHESWRVYEYIARHFIASVSPDCRIAKTKAVFRIGDCETFKCSGHKMISPGFTTVMPWLQSRDDPMPDLRRFETAPITTVELIEGQTSAPDYLTESELIGLMERNGIGTDASIPVHIQNIQDRGYCQTEQATRTMVPTRLGIALVHGYHKIDPELVLPTVRASIEQNISLIAKGEADYDTVVSHAIAQFQAKYQWFVEHIGHMDELFGASFTKIAQSEGKLLTRCGRCRRYMTLIEMKPTRLFCSNCQETYSLPQSGVLREYSQNTCPLDGFELLTYSTGSGATGRSFSVCPLCYNQPSIEDMKPNSGCNLCPHETCPHSMSSRELIHCPECDTGIVCLDPISNPGKNRASCNACSFVVAFPKSFWRVSPSEKECDACGATQIFVEFKSEADCPLPVKVPSATCCILCNPDVFGMCRPSHADMAGDGKKFSRGGRRGGRGGRGRGRGRGRGGHDRGRGRTHRF